MANIGLFYGSSVGTTQRVAQIIREELGDVDVYDVAQCNPDDLIKYDYLILGTSTWSGGVMQDDWDDFSLSLENMDFFGKKVALFGLGDQRGYSDEFVNGMGRLFDRVISRGATVVGTWPLEGYQFDKSRAVLMDKFVGLALDEDNQPEKTRERIRQWARSIKGKLRPRGGSPKYMEVGNV